MENTPLKFCYTLPIKTKNINLIEFYIKLFFCKSVTLKKYGKKVCFNRLFFDLKDSPSCTLFVTLL